MKILFCNITYMNMYTGNIEEDIPQHGGKWVEKHKDAHEKWNFLNVNGTCYGFVMNKNDQFHIERIDHTSKQIDSTDNVTVVWCALNPMGETVIVGWYENATVYRYYQNSFVSPISLDRCYFTKANAEDCYLLPQNQRTYIIGRASIQGAGSGFGQSNFWYADSDYAKTHIVPDVIAYLEANRKSRINTLPDSFSPPENVNQPLSDNEKVLADEYWDNSEYLYYLPFGYRAFNESPIGDHAYFVACALKNLHQYNLAIEWFCKAIEIEGNSWDTTSNLPYLYAECNQFQNAINVCVELLNFPEAAQEDVRMEIYSALADNNMYLGRTNDAIIWLKKILEESSDQILLEHTEQTLSCWSEMQ